MPDPILEAARAKAQSKPTTKDPILALARRNALKDIQSAGRAVAGATPQWAKDIVGSTASFFGKRLGAAGQVAVGPMVQRQFGTGPPVQIGGAPFRPLAAAKRAFVDFPAAIVTGKTPPGEPPGLLENLREHGWTGPAMSREEAARIPVVGGTLRTLSSPEAFSFAVESGLPLSGMNAAMAPVGAGGRALANLEVGGFRTRGLPGVKQGLEFFRPGASLPNAIREEFQNIIRSAEGKADFRAFLREKSLAQSLKLPVEAQDRIQTAIETRAIESLAPVEQQVANALVKEYAGNVQARTQAGLRPWELRQPTEPGKVDVAFTPRVATPEARTKLFGRKPYGSAVEGGPSGLGTGRMAERTASRQLTTQELNAQLAGEEGVRAFEPVVRATIARGAAEDARLVHANVVKDLMDKFGKPIGKGEQSIASLRGVPTGFNDAIKAQMEKTALPKELHEVLENMNKRFQPEEWGKVSQFVHGVNNQFRKWALFSPGFVSRNMQNNLVQTAIFGNMNPLNWTEAFRIRRALGAAKSMDDLAAISLKVGGKKMTGAEYVQSAIERGIVGRGQAAMETARVIGGTPLRPFPGKGVQSKLNPIRLLRQGNTFGEDMSRISFDLFNQSTGMNPVASARRVDQVLFNYSPRFQSAGFAKLRRNYMPFINWSANIPQLFARTVLERPGQLGALGNIRDRMNLAAGAPPDVLAKLPEYIQEQAPVATGPGKEPGSLRVLQPQGYGSIDVSQMVAGAAGGPETLAREAVQRTFPQFGLAYGFATGKSPLTGGDLKRKSTAPAALKLLFTTEAGKKFAESQGIEMQPDGKVKAPAKLAFVLYSLPPLRLANLMADAINPDPNSEYRLKSFLLGVRQVEATPEEAKR